MTRHRPAGRDRAAQRLRLLERDGPACWLCLTLIDFTRPGSAAGPSIDHVIPVSRGGDDSDVNSRLAHLGCNSARGNRPPTDIGPQSQRWL